MYDVRGQPSAHVLQLHMPSLCALLSDRKRVEIVRDSNCISYFYTHNRKIIKTHYNIDIYAYLMVNLRKRFMFQESDL